MTEQAHPTPTPKRINFGSHKLDAGGETYYLSGSLSVSRYVEYLKRVPKLSFHTTFRGMYDTLSKIYAATSSGNDMIFAIQQARELAWNQLDAIKRFDDNEIPDIVDFCCLFMNKSGEDPGKFDLAEHEAKKAVVAAEGYAVEDFFTLAFNLIESFSDAYRKIREAAEKSGFHDISLSQPSQQISSTS